MRADAVSPTRIPRRSADVAVGGVLLALALAYFAALAPYGLNIDDEGTLLYQIYRTYLGQVLYVDFHAGYTPGLFYSNAALFSLFGVNIIVLRLGLALINSLTVTCMYWLARRLGASQLAAATAGLLYVALIPFYDGQFGAFNIPYPTWYVSVFWLASVMCAVRWWESGRSWWWLPAGVCAGVVFAFKPNSGLLDLAGLLIALTLLEQPGPASTPGQRNGLTRLLLFGERALGWVVPVGLTVSLTALFGRGDSWRDVGLFALPLIVIVGFHLFSHPIRRQVREAAPFSRWCNLLALGSGFALVSLPWIAYFWSHLGTRPFLRAILFVGTGFDRFYYIAYPPIGTWGLATAAVFIALVGIGVLLRRRVLRPGLVVAVFAIGGCGATVWLLRHPPPMIEGLQASVLMRVRDVGFVAVLVIEWAALLTYIIQRRRGSVFSIAMAAGERAGMERTGSLFIMIVSAVLMHMQLYPRTDFMHLVAAIPGVLIVAAWSLHLFAELWARGLTASMPGRRLLAAVAVAPAYGFVLIELTPALGRIGYLARAWWNHDETAVVRLDSRRAPLLVEPAAGRPFIALSSTTRFLRDHTRTDDFVFAFPALDLVCFLADRQNPTRHGYFFPGWPGHDVEAEVIDALQAQPPRFIVAMHYHALFFGSAPPYYFGLRQFVTSRYRLERHVGLFDILGPVQGQPESIVAPATDDDTLATTIALWQRELDHRSGTAARTVAATLTALPKATSWHLANAMAALQPPEQQLLLELIRKSQSAPGAAALAMVLEQYLVPGTLHQYFIRVLAEFGDSRAVVPLLRWLPNADAADRPAIAGILFMIAGKTNRGDYLYANSSEGVLADIGQGLNVEQLINWIDNPFEFFGLRFFAISMAGAMKDPLVVPFLTRVLTDPNEHVDLHFAAASVLIKLGYGRQTFPIIVNQLDSDPLFATLIVAAYDHDGNDGTDAVGEAMRATTDSARATAFWIAATVHDPRLRDDLYTGLSDPLADVQKAATWGLANLGDTNSIATLQQLTAGEDDQVATFARRALQRISRGSGQ